MLIKIKLVKFEKALGFQVLEQDDVSKRGDFSFEVSNGLEIKSYNRPCLSMNTIFIRGEHEGDDLDIDTLEFENNKDRDLHYNKVLLAFEEMSEYFKDIDKAKTEPDTFVF
jgi:hypothetical protein